MKKAGMTIDFKTDSATVFNSNVPLHLMQSGHYILPLTSPLQLLAKQDADPHTKIVLTATSTKSPKEIALKLHRQFTHAPYERIVSCSAQLEIPGRKMKSFKRHSNTSLKSAKHAKSTKSHPCVLLLISQQPPSFKTLLQ